MANKQFQISRPSFWYSNLLLGINNLAFSKDWVLKRFPPLNNQITVNITSIY